MVKIIKGGKKPGKGKGKMVKTIRLPKKLEWWKDKKHLNATKKKKAAAKKKKK